MVRRLSPRIPEPTCCRLCESRAPINTLFCCSHSRARSSAIALALFCVRLRSVSQRTASPDGLCLIKQQLLVLFLFCPPEPLPRIIWHSMSDSEMRTCASVGSGNTATVIVLVWTRPRFSVGGTRCQRCPPASFANTSFTFGPLTSKITIPERCSIISKLKTPPNPQLNVNGELLKHQVFGVCAAFSGSNLYDHGTPLLVLIPQNYLYSSVSSGSSLIFGSFRYFGSGILTSVTEVSGTPFGFICGARTVVTT